MSKLAKTFILFLFITTGLNAQKVKLKGYKVSAEHVNLPTIGFPPEITTYDCSVDGNEAAINRYGLTFGDIESRIKIGGYNKVEGGGSARLSVEIGAPTASAREKITKDREDKDKNKYKLYSYSFDLSCIGSYKVTDSKGSILSEGNVTKKKKHSTKEFKSLTALNAHYKDKYPKTKNDELSKLLNEVIRGINNKINAEFSVATIKSTVEFEGFKAKSHPDLNKFKEVKTTVENAFKKMTSADNSEFIEAIQPAIKFWLEKEPTYSTSDKQAKKLNFACRYNAALAYYWAEDFANALKYAELIIDGDYNEKKGKRLKEKITKTQERLNALNLKSRHFKVEVSETDKAAMVAFNEEQEEIYGSGDIRRFPEFDKIMNVKLESKIARGKLFLKDGNVDEGYYVYESDTNTPNFSLPRTIRFGKESNGKILKGNPEYKSIDSMLIGDKIYRIQAVQLGPLKMKNAIVEDVKNYNKTTLQLIHPPFAKGRVFGTETELETSYAIWHKSKKKHFSPDGLSFSKTMKKAVGDCDLAMEYVNELKNQNKKKKLLDRVGSQVYDEADLDNILTIYDECK